MSELRDEVYDWLAEEQRQPVSAPIVRRTETSVNPVNGHGRGCECAQCPGWYERRDALQARELHMGRVAVAPPERRPNPLLDQVVPVSILMAMVTVCGLVLLPVIVPLMAISAVLIVAVAVVVMAGAVAVIYAVSAVKQGHRELVRGEVVRRRRGWR